MSKLEYVMLRGCEDYYSRAEECRTVAEKLRNEQARQKMLKAADVHERTAAQTAAAIQ
jgi:hypothetical protein